MNTQIPKRIADPTPKRPTAGILFCAKCGEPTAVESMVICQQCNNAFCGECLDIGISEDIKAGASPDIGLLISWKSLLNAC